MQATTWSATHADMGPDGEVNVKRSCRVLRQRLLDLHQQHAARNFTFGVQEVNEPVPTLQPIKSDTRPSRQVVRANFVILDFEPNGNKHIISDYGISNTRLLLDLSATWKDLV